MIDIGQRLHHEALQCLESKLDFVDNDFIIQYEYIHIEYSIYPVNFIIFLEIEHHIHIHIDIVTCLFQFFSVFQFELRICISHIHIDIVIDIRHCLRF